MTAQLLIHERQPLAVGLFKEVKVWRLPEPVAGCAHLYKYRLALVANDRCVLRYGNERGKGDHKHIGDAEAPMTFTDLATLLADFHRDIRLWRRSHEQADDSC
ncbi:MAG: hypothetical protein KFB96_05720 [Thiocapsa sp.]|uniref:toxin-antitoxin system TumE family protein n=1 Tax=Thiocapsa sp. TaxID=2024551 RepID=UPI001BCCD459|nr:DUF6516 family protein [Thiocapsa sp.]QVL49976.1 MAG: hypothetical protein KFB96_05720 [Thiocapsa sp.]